MRLTDFVINNQRYRGEPSTDEEGRTHWPTCVLWDDAIQGLGVRIMPPVRGRPSRKDFIVTWKVGLKSRTMAIGTYGVDCTLRQARRIARETIDLARRGRDPIQERQQALGIGTTEDLASRFLHEHTSAKKRQPEEPRPAEPGESTGEAEGNDEPPAEFASSAASSEAAIGSPSVPAPAEAAEPAAADPPGVEATAESAPPAVAPVPALGDAEPSGLAESTPMAAPPTSAPPDPAPAGPSRPTEAVSPAQLGTSIDGAPANADAMLSSLPETGPALASSPGQTAGAQPSTAPTPAAAASLTGSAATPATKIGPQPGTEAPPAPPISAPSHPAAPAAGAASRSPARMRMMALPAGLHREIESRARALGLTMTGYLQALVDLESAVAEKSNGGVAAVGPKTPAEELVAKLRTAQSPGSGAPDPDPSAGD